MFAGNKVARDIRPPAQKWVLSCTDNGGTSSRILGLERDPGPPLSCGTLVSLLRLLPGAFLRYGDERKPEEAICFVITGEQ